MRTHETSEAWFQGSDGARLFYRMWKPREPSNRAVFLFHRGHEHSGRLMELAEDLELDGFWIFAWDQRGHGRSPGDRGYADSLSQVVADLDRFVAHVGATHGIPIEETAVVAYSVASVIVSAWVHDYAPRIRAMVLAAPALRVKLYVPFALPLLRLQRWLLGPAARVDSYVKSRMLTSDPEKAREYDADPLIARAIATNLLIDLFDTSTRLMADAGAIRVPTLLLTAGSDWVVETEPQRRLFEGLGSRIKEHEVYPSFHHAIFHEKQRHLPVERTRRFLFEAFASPPEDESDLLEADRHGYTRDEFERLNRQLRPTDPKAWWFALGRLFLDTVGRLSDGVRIGWASGFDSGEMLDYVYEDRASGLGTAGRLLDRVYLDQIGWEGIRIRRRHLAARVRTAIDEALAARGKAHVVDVAAGPGRYLIELSRELGEAPVTMLCRDWSETAVQAGRVLARRQGATRVAHARGDAFDPDSLAALDPRPDVAVISGLFELFPENAPIRRCLAGLRRALPQGGTLVYTNQPWHPQVEDIARMLVNREGKAWIMRRRTQAEMDALVREAGFEKQGMDVDPWGIFTVSRAVLRSPQ